MDQPKRGYDLPYPADTGTRIGVAVVVSISTIASLTLALWEIESGEPEAWVLLIIPVLMVVLLLLPALFALKAQLHLVPEGIAITLFGKTIRRFPAESIRFLTAIKGSKNSNRIERIAVCNYSLEELTELGHKHTPKFLRIAYPRWPGEFAGQYLYGRMITLPGEMNLHQRILWLDWTPERLRLLRKMYPKAHWLDCTREQLFEKQLQNS